MKTILIIEDEEVLLSILEEKLRNEGFTVETAMDGEAGIEKAQETLPGLILLDIVMPKMDGFGVIDALKVDEETQHIPIVVISNSGAEAEVDRLEKIGVEDYLVKANFSPQEVMDKVNMHLASNDEDSHNSDTNNEENMTQENSKTPQDKEGEENEDEVVEKEDSDQKTLVIVEDERFLRDVIVTKLSEANYDVVTATDGEEGVKAIQENKPDIVLLDLLLPGVDGFEVLSTVKEDDSLKHIPIVIVSNFSADDKRKRAMELGAESYMVKAEHLPKDFVAEAERVLSEK